MERRAPGAVSQGLCLEGGAGGAGEAQVPGIRLASDPAPEDLKLEALFLPSNSGLPKRAGGLFSKQQQTPLLVTNPAVGRPLCTGFLEQV